MRIRRPLTITLALACTFVLTAALGVAAPAGAAPLRPLAASTSCNITDPEILVGATLVNNKTVNGTWDYATGVSCGFQAADIVLFQQLNLNGTKVDSKLKGFTGTPRSADAILSQFPCAMCNGTWQFVWGQIVKAPSGFMFSSPPTGCVTVSSGLYLVCVQTKTVTI